MKETSPKSNNGTILDINESFKIEFDPISDALAAIRNGECIIVVDDERRENIKTKKKKKKSRKSSKKKTGKN
jgi:3,4-dihydroxy 2-butanone 4-phosphate synthase/GTP cyclohydrolase II